MRDLQTALDINVDGISHLLDLCRRYSFTLCPLLTMLALVPAPVSAPVPDLVPALVPARVPAFMLASDDDARSDHERQSMYGKYVVVSGRDINLCSS